MCTYLRHDAQQAQLIHALRRGRRHRREPSRETRVGGEHQHARVQARAHHLRYNSIQFNAHQGFQFVPIGDPSARYKPIAEIIDQLIRWRIRDPIDRQNKDCVKADF
jgi:hypothetical protein